MRDISLSHTDTHSGGSSAGNLLLLVDGKRRNLIEKKKRMSPARSYSAQFLCRGFSAFSVNYQGTSLSFSLSFSLLSGRCR